MSVPRSTDEAEEDAEMNGSSRVTAWRLTVLGTVVIAAALGARAAPVDGTQGSRAASRIPLGQLLHPIAKLGDGAEGGESESPTIVALSSNGDTALVGAPGDDGGIGSVSVFARSGSTWSQQGPPLAGSGEIGQGAFGSSVALSADGDVALIGGRSDGSSSEGQCCASGAAWVFTRSGSTWTQQDPVLTDGRASDSAEFGTSVALSASGATALVGAPGSGRAGAAWILARTRSGWQRGGKLAVRGATNAGFGSTVALASNGGTALIGAGGGSSAGGAWVFTRQHSRWSRQGGRLTGKEQSGRLGATVALSSDGDTALVGAGGEDGEHGAVWIFTRSGSTWQRRAKLTGRDERGLGNFGESVALSANGKVALFGCPQENSSGLARVGSVWLFSGSGSRWTRRAKLAAAGTSIENGLFGISVALSGAGTTALVGVEVDDGGPGTAWVLSSSFG
jgi:phage gpG-like protein